MKGLSNKHKLFLLQRHFNGWDLARKFERFQIIESNGLAKSTEGYLINNLEQEWPGPFIRNHLPILVV